MKKSHKVISLLMTFFLLLIGITIIFLTSSCIETDKEYANKRVIKYLNKNSLDPSFLRFDASGTKKCVVSFIYKTDKEHIRFSVFNGGELAFSDYNKNDK